MTCRRLTCALVLCAAPLRADNCEVFLAMDLVAQEGSAPVGATCETYLTEIATTGVSCRWPFDLRDPKAKTFADEIWNEAPACRPGNAQEAGKEVNHPDSYALRLWRSDSVTYAVSVKDKGRLDRTFVFVRREPR